MADHKTPLDIVKAGHKPYTLDEISAVMDDLETDLVEGTPDRPATVAKLQGILADGIKVMSPEAVEEMRTTAKKLAPVLGIDPDAIDSAIDQALGNDA